MPGGYGNIKPEDNTEGFQKNPQNINTDGRPRKLVGQVVKELNEKGVKNVTAQQVVGTIETLLNCTESAIKRYATDSKQPMFIRMIAQHMMDAEDNSKILEMLLDRAHGKAVQKQQIEVGPKPPQSLDELYDQEEIDKLKEAE